MLVVVTMLKATVLINAESTLADYNYAESNLADCHYAECHGTI
jgi:hypothetical protein